MSKSVKKKVRTSEGKNVRFSGKGHKIIADYCKQNGYNIGAFCEIAALEKIKNKSQ